MRRHDDTNSIFARNVFAFAGIWGLVLLAPLYFSFDVIGSTYPPQITHPDFFYGFVGVAIAWQVAFLFIARDPVALQPMMVPAMLEKFTYVLTLIVLYAQGRLHFGQFLLAIPDFVLGVLFAVAFLRLEAGRRLHAWSGDYSGAIGD
jgi:hypothetical protein